MLPSFNVRNKDVALLLRENNLENEKKDVIFKSKQTVTEYKQLPRGSCLVILQNYKIKISFSCQNVKRAKRRLFGS